MLTVKKYITRFITLVVALQLLNLSIYAQDFKPICTETGLSETNITETIVEYVAENLLGHTNAIPEQSQHHKDLHFHKHISFKAISFPNTFGMPEIEYPFSDIAISLKESYSYLYKQEITPPPPKV